MPAPWNIFAFICRNSRTLAMSASVDILRKEEWYHVTVEMDVEFCENFRQKQNFLKLHLCPTIFQSWMFFMTFNMCDFSSMAECKVNFNFTLIVKM